MAFIRPSYYGREFSLFMIQKYFHEVFNREVISNSKRNNHIGELHVFSEENVDGGPPLQKGTIILENCMCSVKRM